MDTPTPLPFDRAVELYYEEIKFALDNGTITVDEAMKRSQIAELNRHLSIGLATGLVAPRA